MVHTKTITRSDGTKYQICVSLYIDSRDITCRIEVWKCLKGKRKFVNVFSGDDYTYRKLDYKDRLEFIKNKHLEYVTEQEIYAAKLELLDKIKISI